MKLEERLNEIIIGHKIEIYSDLKFDYFNVYNKKNELLICYNKQNNTWISYFHIWSIFEKKHRMKDDTIYKFMKKMLLKYFNLNNVKNLKKLYLE